MSPAHSAFSSPRDHARDHAPSRSGGWRRSTALRLGLGVLTGALIAVPVIVEATPASSAYAESAAAGSASQAKKKSGNVVTPGDFRGYGFDQCLAPNQRTMDKWLHYSPFLAAGIYISGDSRACRSQPNLTPRWISTQLARGWRLLPITLGPQASCQPRFPRYRDDFKISAAPGNGTYPAATTMGTNEATKTVGDAQRLGISKGSTLWYDLEGFDVNNKNCRESALRFLSSWTKRLHALGYVSGVYSSAGSGMVALDQARRKRPTVFTLPDRIWVARWDGQANTSTSYIAEDGWRPGNRIKQYRGGHDEVWGGARINIDSNYLELGRGSVAAPESHCGGTRIDYAAYSPLAPGKAKSKATVRALQCLLKEQRVYSGAINGAYNPATIAAVRTWQTRRGFAARKVWSRPNWVALLALGTQPVAKVGSAGSQVRRVQRAMNAAKPGLQLPITGVYDARTSQAVAAYQRKVGVHVSGITNSVTWKPMLTGRR